MVSRYSGTRERMWPIAIFIIPNFRNISSFYSTPGGDDAKDNRRTTSWNDEMID